MSIQNEIIENDEKEEDKEDENQEVPKMLQDNFQPEIVPEEDVNTIDYHQKLFNQSVALIDLDLNV